MGRREEWSDLFHSLGEAILDLLSAERDALADDLRRSGKTLLVAVALFFVAASLVFWFLGVLTATAVAALARWLPVWAASLVVSLTVLAVAGLLAWLGLRRWRTLEAPTETVRRRWDEHRDWWREEALPEGAEGVGSSAGGTDGPSTGG